MNKLILTQPEIIKIEDLSEANLYRALVHFKNGYVLSIIQGKYTHGGPEGLFEIAPIKADNSWASELFDEEDKGDDVLGWLTPTRVRYYIEKIAKQEPQP